MSKIKRTKKNNKSSNKIKQNATSLKDKSWNEKKARLSFLKACDRHCLLSDWNSRELRDLMNYFKKVERLTWNKINLDSGLDYEKIKSIAISRPQSLPPDATLNSMRVSGKIRVYGYRYEDTFNLIWFDRNHIVCPMGKSKPYSV